MKNIDVALQSIKVLVTGATGFIGSELINYLNQVTLSVIPCSRQNKTDHLPYPDFLKGHLPYGFFNDVDVVIHTAGLAHVPLTNTSDFFSVNRDQTLILAKAAADAGVKRFIFLSTIGVLGAKTDLQPFNEQTFPSPSSDYALSKYEAELGLLELSEISSMEIVIIRPPLVYGANAKGNFRRLKHWICKGFPMPFGLVKHNKRSLVGINNLIDFISVCMVHPAAANQVFVVSDNDDVSTAGLVSRLSHALGQSTRLIPVPVSFLQAGISLLKKPALQHQLLSSLQIDIAKAQNLLEWSPPLTFEEGIKLCCVDTSSYQSGNIGDRRGKP